MPEDKSKKNKTENVTGKTEPKEKQIGRLMHDIPADIELLGNAEGKILAEAFRQFSKDGLTTTDRIKIEALDNIFQDADIVISKGGSTATIAQENGKTFVIKAPPIMR